jgi:hypothetical protein
MSQQPTICLNWWRQRRIRESPEGDVMQQQVKVSKQTSPPPRPVELDLRSPAGRSLPF